ncbi:phosphate acetyltransferase [Sedimentitalea nanhaiensis]|uniref:Phosphate acetyltransferase n=1 Tax=Sedimentitalea nanhaiensis TaxID=999627 RepID=A0A1I7DFE6_9RHOB|nr:phosphate acetyltransferase [Sedimentitalea nanhaiensis]SFU10327.1 phosphate acetyltransferase [Sedimentitalea nanhaiensis]
MKPLEIILANAARSDRKIVLSEGEDPRVVAAAIEAAKQNVARIVLVGNRETVARELALSGGQNLDRIEVHDPKETLHHSEMSAAYHELRKHKGVTLEAASAAILNPHVYAALLVKLGYADGTLGGATTTTAEIVRNAIQVIGTAADAKMVSSFFLMLLCKDHHEKKGALVFSDAGLVIDPSASEMAEIAHASAASLVQLTGETPKVAMLSFSTRGSAAGDKVSKVVEATAILRKMAPDMIVDGELQFDAAFVPDVATAKAPGSTVGGSANVFIFPNLDTGNVAYKIAQRIGGAVAIGPILQGLAQPANDLSRGCTAEDILHMIAVTAAQC